MNNTIKVFKSGPTSQENRLDNNTNLYQYKSNYNNPNGYQNMNSNRNRYNDSNSLMNNDVKNLLLNYLFSSLEMSKYRYKIINNLNDLAIFRNQKFYVSANFAGINSMLIFIKLNGVDYSFTVDKKTLSYSMNNIDLSKVKLYPAKVRLEENIYNGTIFDGIYINNTKEFIITDVMYFRGKNMVNENIHHKLLSTLSYLQKFYKKGNDLNAIELIVNRLYELENINELVRDITNLSNCKGLSFQPEISGSYTKLIYMLIETDLKTDIMPSVKSKKKETDIIKINQNKLNNEDILTFKMKATDIDDVYKLYLIYKSKQNEKTTIKNIKIDIAFIPDIKTSKMCKKIFKDTTEVLMKCQYDKEKEKWIPESVNKKDEFPSLINKYI